jgi:hypothetical protein
MPSHKNSGQYSGIGWLGPGVTPPMPKRVPEQFDQKKGLELFQSAYSTDLY